MSDITSIRAEVAAVLKRITAVDDELQRHGYGASFVHWELLRVAEDLRRADRCLVQAAHVAEQLEAGATVLTLKKEG
jgi:hypothetical protein